MILNIDMLLWVTMRSEVMNLKSSEKNTSSGKLGNFLRKYRFFGTGTARLLHRKN
jgi:hypothetical protein